MAKEVIDPAYKAAADDLLLSMPGVSGGKSFGYDSYSVNGKLFAFLKPRGIAIKLTAPRVQELLGTRPEFSMYHWKAWLVIEPDTPDHYDEYEALFLEALAGVAEGKS
jgi:hypothetical protein